MPWEQGAYFGFFPAKKRMAIITTTKKPKKKTRKIRSMSEKTAITGAMRISLAPNPLLA